MNTVQNKKTDESFRFDIYKGKLAQDGSFQKIRVAGHAYLRSGKHAYKVKLFALTQDRFIIVPSDNNRDLFKIMTKEEVVTKDKGKRTYWNIVGEGEMISSAGMMKLKFDLFGEILYMSIHPANTGNVLAFQSLVDRAAA